MVVIIDPHLKRVQDYPVFAEAEKGGLIVKKSSGDDYEGWCWSGSSAWVDFFNPASTEWWKGLFSLVDQKWGGWMSGWRWKEVTGSVFIWNDMNEVWIRLEAYTAHYQSVPPVPACRFQWPRGYHAKG